MRWEVEEELGRLIEKLHKGNMYKSKANNFFDICEWEDEYSHNEISDLQSEFADNAKVYLKENYEGKYAVRLGAFCVHIITVDWMKEKGLKYWTVC